ncbi:MAG: glycosyltransferase involved in cell wall biosynthesis [Flavobacteriales bacterium]|jgi:glycosyltransferase involved in cell wall biosynthesis
MKKILVDIDKTQNLFAGLGQFSLHFAEELLKLAPKNIAIDFLISTKKQRDLFPTHSRFTKTSFFQQFFSFLLAPYDIWHSLHQFPAILPSKKSNLILTIHDLNFLIEKNELKSQRYLRKLQKNVDRAVCITTISNYTKQQIEKHLQLRGKEIHVIYNGIKPNNINQPEKPAFAINKPFLFSIGIFNQKKNFHTLVAMMENLPELNLIIAGNNNTDYGRFVAQEIKRLNLSNIVLAGKISESNKAWLYNHCDAFVFPSLAEGFGMPVIEAMTAGKPVFLSTFTSLPEIGGELAFYFQSFEPKEMAELIQDNLASVKTKQPGFSEATIKYAEKFDWNHCIKQYAKVYQQILAQ